MRRVITFALVVVLTYAGLWAFAPAHSGPGPRAAAVHLTARAGRPGFKVVRFAGYTHQGPRELASVPAGPRSQPVRPVRPACGLPRPARGQPAVPRAPGRPHRDDQHPGGRFHPGAGLRHGQPGGHRGRDRDPAAGRRVSDPRRPGSGDGHLARGSGRIGHRDLHRGRPRGAVHPAQPAAGGPAAHAGRSRAGPGPRDDALHGGPALRAAVRRTPEHGGGSACRGPPACLARHPVRAPAHAPGP